MTELVCNFFPASTSNSTEMMTFEWVLAQAKEIRKEKINSNNVNIVKCNEEITTRGLDGKEREKFDAWHKTSPMGLISFFSSSFHSFRYFCLFYFSVNITVSYALRVVTSKWSLIYVQQPLVILFPKNIYSYIHIKSYKKETIMMMWCHTLFSMSSPSTFNYQHSTIFSTFILMCLLDVQ